MINILRTQEIGSLRKPPELMNLWKKYIAGKTEYDALLQNIRRTSKYIVHTLEKIGLTYVWDGEMHRWEMYYHPVTNINGFELAGQVRIFDNRYFIKGIVRGKPKLTCNYYLNEFLFVKSIASHPVKIPITGPYTIADWTYNEYYFKKWSRNTTDLKLAEYKSKEEFVLDLAREVINPILKELSGRGAERIQIDEPAATTHPREMDIFVEGFNECVRGISSTVTIHICYSDYTILAPYINELKTRHIALEFANRDLWTLGTKNSDRPGYKDLKIICKEYGYDGEIGLGVLDVHTDKLEPPDLIKDRIIYALKYVDPDKLFINPDCGLRTRQLSIAFKKLTNMIEGVKLACKEMGIRF